MSIILYILLTRTPITAHTVPYNDPSATSTGGYSSHRETQRHEADGISGRYTAGAPSTHDKTMTSHFPYVVTHY
jgi:hypothetical protein